MINVHKLGTLGNNLWQYAVSRSIAEENNLKLNCYSIPGFPETFIPVEGETYYDPTIVIEGHYFDPKLDFRSKRIEMKGYVQRYEYIKKHKDQIKNWLKLEVLSPIEVLPDDFVVSIRRGWNGYPASLCPPKEFFLDIFSKVKHGRIILCTDTFEDSFFDFIEDVEVEVIKAKYSPLEQFAIIQSANKILLTSSTYCWWAAFLSDAKEIYYPWIANMISQETGHDWFVDDEERYIIVHPNY
jgi:hypothetical protein